MLFCLLWGLLKTIRIPVMLLATTCVVDRNWWVPRCFTSLFYGVASCMSQHENVWNASKYGVPFDRPIRYPSDQFGVAVKPGQRNDPETGQPIWAAKKVGPPQFRACMQLA